MRAGYVFATLVSCYVVLGQQPECTAEDNGQYYDLTSLRSKYGIPHSHRAVMYVADFTLEQQTTNLRLTLAAYSS
jgi:hypothetical protein